MPVKLTPAAMFWSGLALAGACAALLAAPAVGRYGVDLSAARTWVYVVVGLLLQGGLFVGAGLVAGSFVLRALQPDEGARVDGDEEIVLDPPASR